MKKTHSFAGRFDYKQASFSSANYLEGVNNHGYKWIYIGQVKPDTELMHGAGMYITANGEMYEGFWEDGKFSGRGRYIYEGELK